MVSGLRFVTFLLMDLKCPILGLVSDISHKLFGSVVIDSYRYSSSMGIVGMENGTLRYDTMLRLASTQGPGGKIEFKPHAKGAKMATNNVRRLRRLTQIILDRIYRMNMILVEAPIARNKEA
jgi:hypothetical protein